MINTLTFNDCVASYVKRPNPQKTIMVFNEQAVTLADLIRNVDWYTRHLIAMGIKPGMGIGYTLPNCPQIFYLFLAVARLGGYTVPLFPMIPDAGKVNIFKNGRVQWVITSSAQLAGLQAASEKMGAEYKLATIDAGETAAYSLAGPADISLHTEDYLLKQTAPHLPLLMAATSGTTGTPKAVMMTQGNAGAVIQATMDMVAPVELAGKEGYSSVLAFPLSTSGILVTLGTLFGGVDLIFSEDMSPVKYLQLLTQTQADSLSAPPAYFEALLSLPMLGNFELRSVKRILTGMDFLSPALLARLKSKFVNIDSAASGYGLVETATVFMHSKVLSEAELEQPLNRMQLVENIGNAIDVRDENGISVTCGEIGELCVKGATVVQGYLGNPAETEAGFRDGWFKTGDIVRKETDTTVTLLGRRKYLIKRGGKSVSPLVVQNHLNALPGIKDSAVVGIPHRFYGEMIWAFVVKSQGSAVELKDIMSHCRIELPNYMLPDQVTFIDAIPKNPGVGKVDYEKLKQIAQEELKLMGEGEEHV